MLAAAGKLLGGYVSHRVFFVDFQVSVVARFVYLNSRDLTLLVSPTWNRGNREQGGGPWWSTVAHGGTLAPVVASSPPACTHYVGFLADVIALLH